MADQDQEVQNFANAFGLGGGGSNPYDIEPEVQDDQAYSDADEASDEIRGDEGPEERMSMEEAQSFVTGEEQEYAEEQGEYSEEAEEPETERDWAIQLLEQVSNPQVDDGGDGEPVAFDPRVQQLETELAVQNARLDENRRHQDLLYSGDSDATPTQEAEEFDISYYSSEDVVKQIQESYNLDEEVAQIVAKVAGVTTQHYDDKVVGPRIQRLEAQINQQVETQQSSQNERETLSNLSAVATQFEQDGDELEQILIQQLVQHGIEKSFLGQYFQQGQNRYLATSPEGIRDATETVARKVRAKAEQSDSGMNTVSKREPVGEQRNSSIGRAVRRGPGARQAQTVDRDAELRAAIRNSGRPAIPLLMS